MDSNPRTTPIEEETLQRFLLIRKARSRRLLSALRPLQILALWLRTFLMLRIVRPLWLHLAGLALNFRLSPR
jgi:hypothetical protein